MLSLRKTLLRYIRRPSQFYSTLVNSDQNTTAIKWPRRIFSGIQPTGSVHLGNYFGAIKNWVDLQSKGEDVMVCIVDLHSITLPQDPAALQSNILDMTATLLACGVDPEKSILFLQSSVPRHAELCWVLNCLATMARLSHLPQFKEKSQNMKEVPLGLFVYPVLQAADILLYKATHVPVGEDQLQHLQMAQQLVKTFNYKFGKHFPNPHALIADDGSMRLRSLRDPSKKMSKSDPDPKSRILVTDSPDVIMKNIKKAVTDCTPEVTYDMSLRPGVSNLINIHCLSVNKIPEEVVEENEGINTGRYKMVVSEAVTKYLKPIREKYLNYIEKPDYLVEVLQYGARKARVRADITYDSVYESVGLGIPSQKKIKEHVLSV